MPPTIDMDEKLSFLATIDGTDFLERMRNAEDRCARESLDRLKGLGKRAPGCFAQMGRSLAVLDALASCFFGCRGGDHAIEYLAGRIVATAFAGLRLSLQGYYDESLALPRNAGEIANLFVLFYVNRATLNEWKTSDRTRRLKSFSPVKVRCALEALRLRAPISEDRYLWLCEGIAHGTPDTKPQSHNVLGMPTVGGTFQEAGLLLFLNEAAIVIAFALPFTAKLVDAPDSVVQLAKAEALHLESHIGGVQATTIDKYWEDARKHLSSNTINEAPKKSEPDKN